MNNADINHEATIQSLQNELKYKNKQIEVLEENSDRIQSKIDDAFDASDEVKAACEAIVGRVDGLYLSTDNTVFSAIASVVNVFGKSKKPVFSGDVTAAREGGIFTFSDFCPPAG